MLWLEMKNSQRGRVKLVFILEQTGIEQRSRNSKSVTYVCYQSSSEVLSKIFDGDG